MTDTQDINDFFDSVLACPTCNSGLERMADCFVCQSCDSRFGIVEGIPYFAQAQQDYENEASGIAFRKRYEWQYHNEKDALDYDESFRKSARKRQRTRRELEIVSGFLNGKEKLRMLLDIPCGGGRLSEPMSSSAECLVEADISPAQLELALGLPLGNQRGMVMSALDLPFASGSIDGVVCARLSHHLPEAAERERLLAGLLRVAKKFVIFSFTDRNSIQSFGRKIRGKKLNPCAMAVAEIEQICSVNGAKLVGLQTVSNIGPRHRFALITKTQ